jgi:hypothetical protein
LKSPAHAEVKLEVLDAKGQVVRSYSSKDQPFRPQTAPAFPMYWIRPADPPSAAAGMHRFVWDIRYTAPPIAQPGYSMSTAAGTDTPREPQGPQALPGNYQVRLTVDGATYTQPFKLVMDPRVKTPEEGLEWQFAVEEKLVRMMRDATQMIEEIHAAAQAGKISADDESRLAGTRRQRGQQQTPTAPGQEATLSQVLGNLAQLMVTIDSADAKPTQQEMNAAEKAMQQISRLSHEWQRLKGAKAR